MKNYIWLYHYLNMDVDKLIQEIKELTIPPESMVKQICNKVKEIFLEESNLQNIHAPVTVCGDIHGQFHDLNKIFHEAGALPHTAFIFIGDFVDRGYHSIETLLLLLLLKMKHPDRITLLRGNHESRQVSSMYGFYEEINRKYGNTNVWKYCNDVFDYFPLAALIDNSILCVHGGLSPDIRGVDQIREIDRKREIDTEGPFCDLMWSDPEDIDGWAPNQRGAGYLFGERVVDDFCRLNNLKLIARAHQLVQDGYQQWFTNKNLVTVWSAPNYCYRCNNLASFMKVDDHLDYTFTKFTADEKSKDSKHYKNLMPYFL